MALSSSTAADEVCLFYEMFPKNDDDKESCSWEFFHLAHSNHPRTAPDLSLRLQKGVLRVVALRSMKFHNIVVTSKFEKLRLVQRTFRNTNGR